MVRDDGQLSTKTTRTSFDSLYHDLSVHLVCNTPPLLRLRVDRLERVDGEFRENWT